MLTHIEEGHILKQTLALNYPSSFPTQTIFVQVDIFVLLLFILDQALYHTHIILNCNRTLVT